MSHPSSTVLTPDERARLDAVVKATSLERVAAIAKVSASTVSRAKKADPVPATRASTEAIRGAIRRLERELARAAATTPATPATL